MGAGAGAGAQVQYVSLLSPGLPRDIKLQSWRQYTLRGVVEYFRAKLRDLGDYTPLRSGVFQMLRELGNFLCFADMADAAVRLKCERHARLLRDLADAPEPVGPRARAALQRTELPSVFAHVYPPSPPRELGARAAQRA